MINVGRQRNRELAKALMMTSNGKATTNPAPRTTKPNTSTETLTSASPLNANVPIGAPCAMNDRITEMRADDQEQAAQNGRKVGGSHLASRPQAIVTSDQNRA